MLINKKCIFGIVLLSLYGNCGESYAIWPFGWNFHTKPKPKEILRKKILNEATKMNRLETVVQFCVLKLCSEKIVVSKKSPLFEMAKAKKKYYSDYNNLLLSLSNKDSSDSVEHMYYDVSKVLYKMDKSDGFRGPEGIYQQNELYQYVLYEALPEINDSFKTMGKKGAMLRSAFTSLYDEMGMEHFSARSFLICAIIEFLYYFKCINYKIYQSSRKLVDD